MVHNVRTRHARATGLPLPASFEPCICPLARGRLAEQAAALIADPENRIHVSAVTLWEIAIKHALRRGAADDMPISATDAKG